MDRLLSRYMYLLWFGSSSLFSLSLSLFSLSLSLSLPPSLPPSQEKASATFVGFANLPNQVFRKAVKRGFQFSLMVVGKSLSLSLSLSLPLP